jgi:hypothetical protein
MSNSVKNRLHLKPPSSETAETKPRHSSLQDGTLYNTHQDARSAVQLEC